ncbi:hypothetical protein AB0945_21835 [Streptomyces sp. NPDC005474]|uniref:hypothetical protein n=1 Tax=Streptomyces sp. NPDC005474 TaxID=3154878 RepID=UPI0034556CDD
MILKPQIGQPIITVPRLHPHQHPDKGDEGSDNNEAQYPSKLVDVGHVVDGVLHQLGRDEVNVAAAATS